MSCISISSEKLIQLFLFLLIKDYSSATCCSSSYTPLHRPSTTMPATQTARQTVLSGPLLKAGTGESFGVIYMAFTMSR